MKNVTPEMLTLADGDADKAAMLEAALESLTPARRQVPLTFNETLRQRLQESSTVGLATARPHRRALLIAAGLVVFFVGLFFLFPRQPASLAFADVIRQLDQTHTFTAHIEMPAPIAAGLPKGTRFPATLSVKGSNIRTDCPVFSLIGSQASSKFLILLPAVHQAMHIPAFTYVDLYSLVHDYRTGTEKAVGEKMIGAHSTKGFQLPRPAFDGAAPTQMWTFWIDEVSRLPLEVDIADPAFDAPIILTNLHFNIPLEESLFDTKIPGGYVDPTAADGSQAVRKFAGQVTDSHGQPIEGVEVLASERSDAFSPGSYNTLGVVKTDKDGHFAIDAGPEHSGFAIGMDLNGFTAKRMKPRMDDPIRLEFRHQDFIYTRLEDLRLLPASVLGDLHVQLREGVFVTGEIVDVAGHAVENAHVEAVYARMVDGHIDRQIRENYSKVTRTDGHGRFELKGLMPENFVVQVRAVPASGPVLWGRQEMHMRNDQPGPIHIEVMPLQLPAGAVIHELLGMKVVDVTNEIRAGLSLRPWERLLIIEPGPNAVRLHLGGVRQGDCFSSVDGQRFEDFHGFVTLLRAAAHKQLAMEGGKISIDVAYSCFQNGDGAGRQSILLMAEDLKMLPVP